MSRVVEALRSRSVVSAFALAVGVLGWSKRPNAALLLADFLMSPKGQATWNGGGESASLLPNIPGSLDNKSLTPVDLVPYTADFVKTQTARWTAIFKK